MVKDKKALAVVPKKKTPHIDHVVDKKKVNGAIIPKPTKAEIVEALVLKKYQAWQEERTKLAADYAAAQGAFVSIVKSELTAKPAFLLDNMKIDTSIYNDEVKINFAMSVKKFPGVVQEAFKRLVELTERRSEFKYDFDRQRCRQAMQDAIRCDPARVAALAASKEVEETLRYIESNRPKPVLTLDNGR